MLQFDRIGTPLSRRVRHRVSQTLAYCLAANSAIQLPPRLASLANDAIEPHFLALDPADRAHLVAVATWLDERGGSAELVTADPLHDIGKALPVISVRVGDRVALVLLRRLWPSAVASLSRRTSPPLVGPGPWVIARHANVGATMLACAGYGQRVQWLVANHERTDLDDTVLQALAAADGDGATVPTR